MHYNLDVYFLVLTRMVGEGALVSELIKPVSSPLKAGMTDLWSDLCQLLASLIRLIVKESTVTSGTKKKKSKGKRTKEQQRR